MNLPPRERSARSKGALTSCRMVGLPRIADPKGSLTFAEGMNHVPFDIRRVYYLYDVPADAERGGHAHKTLEQLLIPLAGSFDVLLDDGRRWNRYRLDRPFRGLYLAPGIWRELNNFTSGAVCLVLASQPFAESDYIRDYDAFLRTVRAAA